MFCPNCGVHQTDGRKFCTTCGTNLLMISQALGGRAPALEAQTFGYGARPVLSGVAEQKRSEILRRDQADDHRRRLDRRPVLLFFFVASIRNSGSRSILQFCRTGYDGDRHLKARRCSATRDRLQFGQVRRFSLLRTCGFLSSKVISAPRRLTIRHKVRSSRLPDHKSLEIIQPGRALLKRRRNTCPICSPRGREERIGRCSSGMRS